MVLANSNIHPEKGVKAINYVFAANMEYFHTAYDTIEKHFGTFQNYIREALHITSAEQQLFRQKYLEK
jgi:hypothetical protein